VDCLEEGLPYLQSLAPLVQELVQQVKRYDFDSALVQLRLLRQDLH